MTRLWKHFENKSFQENSKDTSNSIPQNKNILNDDEMQKAWSSTEKVMEQYGLNSNEILISASIVIEQYRNILPTIVPVLNIEIQPVVQKEQQLQGEVKNDPEFRRPDSPKNREHQKSEKKSNRRKRRLQKSLETKGGKSK